ncbi:MAG: phosphoribosylamine--glycine ligase [Spirochaetaceae bacterium]
MKALVVGGGGREHAIAWKLARSPQVEGVFCAPGNAGTAALPGCTNIDVSEVDEVVAAARARRVDLAVIGPEQPLFDGMADALRAAGIDCLGPSRGAAVLERSKAKAKSFMSRYGIPTASYEIARTPNQAYDAVERMGAPLVVKADGPAAGKGVAVCDTVSEAREAVHSFMERERFGAAGRTVVVERRLSGYEVTVLVLTDGDGAVELPASMDHKPIGDGNTGPNTGGMGVVCPHPHFDDTLRARFRKEILTPTLDGIRTEGHDYRGVLYFGLMVGEEGLSVLEYNVRLGDPEAQAVLPVLGADFAELARAAAAGSLAGTATETLHPERSSCVVVAAAAGYPGDYETGHPIDGLESCRNPVFLAGVREEAGRPVTAGGRVLAVCGTGETPATARAAAYADLRRVSFSDMYYRRDIGAYDPARSR